MTNTGFSIDNAKKIEVSQNSGEIQEINEKYRLEAFALSNFKAFQTTNWIKINDLTLVLGDNSSGKSALYQVLKMLKVCYEKLNQEILFTDLSGVADEVGTFSDLCNKARRDQTVIIDFLFNSASGRDKTLEYCIFIEKADDSDFGKVSLVCIRQKEKFWNLLDYYDTKNLFFLERKSDVAVPTIIGQTVRGVITELRDFAQSFQTISACRKEPSRLMQLSGKEPEEVGESGYNTYNMLFALSQLSEMPVPVVDEWLEKFGYSYKWKMYGANRGEFMLRNIKTGVESNIVDNGFGISQSLPVAAAVATLHGGVILLDSPEAFLQTRMQSEMGDLLIHGASRGRIFVETGSEYLTLRLQRRVAEGIIAPEQISVYFIEEDENGNSKCNAIDLNRKGEFENSTQKFKEFFSSDFWDIEKIDKIRRAAYKRERELDAAEDSD